MDINNRRTRIQQTAKRPTIDGLSPGGAVAISQPYTQRPQQPAPTIQKKRFSPPVTKTSRWEKLQLPLIIGGATIVGLFLKTEAVGITAIVIYSLFAFIFRIPSRTTFALAAMSIAAVTCLLLFKPDLELAGNFTTYTFLLLVTGVITLIVEGKPLKRRRRGRPGRAM